jgi:hypothetical protein
MPSRIRLAIEKGRRQRLLSRLQRQLTTTASHTCTSAARYQIMTIPTSLAPASQIKTIRHPEFHLKPILADPSDPNNYSTPIFSFDADDVISAKLFIDQLNYRHVPHCLWTDPVTPCRPRRRGHPRIPLEQWSGKITVLIFPEILTPSNATIVLMIPYGNARAGTVLWIFPRTMSRSADPNGTPGLIDAEFIKNSLNNYRPLGGDFFFSQGMMITPESYMYKQVHAGLISTHMAGLMWTRRTKWLGLYFPAID